MGPWVSLVRGAWSGEAADEGDPWSGSALSAPSPQGPAGASDSRLNLKPSKIGREARPGASTLEAL